MNRFLCTIMLASALISPCTMKADDDDHHRRVKRYYDRDARDYHEWNEQEARAYRHYLEEQKRENRDWNRVNRREQAEYWRWRHLHPDVR